MSSTLSLEHLERRHFRTTLIANCIQLDTEEIRESLRVIKRELLTSSRREAPVKIDKISNEWNQPSAVSPEDPSNVEQPQIKTLPHSRDVDATVTPSATLASPTKLVEDTTQPISTNTTGAASKFGQGWDVDFELDLL